MKCLNLTISYLVVLYGSFWQQSAHASIHPTDWRGSRTSGQGDATTASSNDNTSVFSNPAGLSSTRNPRSRTFVHNVTFLNAEVGANTTLLSGMNSDPSLWSKSLFQTAREKPQEQSYLEVQSFPQITLGKKNGPTFLLGAPVRTENRVAFLDPSSPENAYVSSRTTMGGAFAISDASKRGMFRYGISARPNYRLDYVNLNYDSYKNTTEELSREIMQKGYTSTGVGLDAGFMVTARDYWFPTLGVAVRNIPTGCVENAKNPYTGKIETICGALRSGAPLNAPLTSRVDPTELRTGISVTPRGKLNSSKVNLRLSFDVHPITLSIDGKNYGIRDIPFSQTIHAGGELYFGNTLLQKGLAFRGGYAEGAPTWGASIDFFYLTLNYSSYVTNESLPQGSGNREFQERRHLLGVSCHW